MIETEVMYKETTKEILYPCLMKHIYSPLIVLMTAHKCGKVISDNHVHDNGGYPVGKSSTDWNPDTFEVFKGSVILENKLGTEKEEITYPCLLEDKYNGAVIGFTAYGEGVVIKSGGQSILGNSSNRWNMNYFIQLGSQESEKQVYPVIMIDPKDGEICLFPKEHAFAILLYTVVGEVFTGLRVKRSFDNFEPLKGKLTLENHKGSVLATTQEPTVTV